MSVASMAEAFNRIFYFFIFFFIIFLFFIIFYFYFLFLFFIFYFFIFFIFHFYFFNFFFVRKSMATASLPRQDAISAVISFGFGSKQGFQRTCAQLHMARTWSVGGGRCGAHTDKPWDAPPQDGPKEQAHRVSSLPVGCGAVSI